MLALPADLTALAPALPAVPALVLLAGAALASPQSGAAAWRVARRASSLALAAAVACALLWLLAGPQHGLVSQLDGTAASIGAVVAFIGWVVVRNACTALAGEPAGDTAVRPLLGALAGGAAVVASNHLLVLTAAWLLTSLALHRLLLFFPERPAARVAAHKKFIGARVADGCMLAACALLYAAFGTLQIDRLLLAATSSPDLPLAAQAAVGLVVLAAVLKCAQLPFHGWLIQVMEAPTPFSALLHAGVVNLGGVVLVRLAPLVAEVPLAMFALVAVGSFTAVVAALVMSTRISIKVSLAWSTCAQMGFMLMQCGLGLWEMALLHLAGHSLYKAHAFLSAGGTVRQSIVRRLSAPAAPLRPAQWLLAAGTTTALVVAAAHWLAPGLAEGATPGAWVVCGILAGALAPLLIARRAEATSTGPAGALPGSAATGVLRAAAGLGVAAALVLWYLALHALLHGGVGPAAPPPAAALAWAAVAFAGLFAVQLVLQAQPHGRLSRWLYPAFYGGLFLDDTVSRPLLRLWPVPAPQPQAPAVLSPTQT